MILYDKGLDAQAKILHRCFEQVARGKKRIDLRDKYICSHAENIRRRDWNRRQGNE